MKRRSNIVLVFATMLLFAFAMSQNVLSTQPPIQGASIFLGAEEADRFAQSDSSVTSVHFINVGRGDAALILSGSSAVLIDGGGEEYGASVVDYLLRQGVGKLDAVIATHPHADHIGGLPAVIDAFQVDAVYMSDEPGEDESYEKLMSALKSNQLTPIFPQIGNVIRFGNSETTLTALGPGPDSAEIFDSRNPDAWSLVFRLDAEGCGILFAGDAPISVEQFLLQQNEAQLNCDILKVSSHGARTASSQNFLDAACPAFAVVSNDESIGEMADSRLRDYLRPYQTNILETAADGTIVFHLQAGEISRAS